MHEYLNRLLQTTTFSPTTMTGICNRLNTYGMDGPIYSVEHCRTKYKRFKRAWKLLHELSTIRVSGLGQDSERNTVIGPQHVLASIYVVHQLTFLYLIFYNKVVICHMSVCIYNHYIISIQEHSNNRGIIKHGLPYFDMCTDIFLRNTATGSNANHLTQMTMSPQQQMSRTSRIWLVSRQITSSWLHLHMTLAYRVIIWKEEIICR